ncbi:MAG: hypothetical protein EP326_01165 [Deltaproteobacteria bacterium]|nr:MAG: hypothetical protein EP326_01165 [Deltaproteobacteria bacterium]TNF25995.1 MAG: hypothetical protein EP319_14915 [Deltaproteobacteria bacterium]
MELIYFKDYHELSLAAHQWVLENISSCKEPSIFVPAGGTPKGLYKIWEQSDKAWAKGVKFFQIDEVITGSKKNLFMDFFDEHLPSFKDQIINITLDQQNRASLGILGLGLNGHVAFHEPHMEPDFTFGEVELTESTRKTLELEDGARGLSYGAGAFLNTEAVLLIVSGEGKREVFQKFLNKDMDLPVSHLHKHDRLMVMALEELKP